LEKADPKEAQKIEAYLDLLNEGLIETVNATGEVFVSHTKLRDRYTIRMAIGNIRSDEAYVARAWELIGEEMRRLDAEMREA
jgi:aromatic-L-amino-acid decarboxylase